MSIYNIKPLQTIGNINHFIESDGYSECYEEIAHEHLQNFLAHGENPFQTNQQLSSSLLTLVSTLKRFASNGQSVLEVGIGLGDLPTELPELKWFAVDISAQYLHKAKDLYVDLALANVESLPHKSNTFDAVVCADVLEHVLKLDRALEEIHRVLKPGGRVFIRVPNEEALDYYLTNEAPAFSHVRTFSYESLRLLLEKCHGFYFEEIEFCEPYFGSVSQLKYKPLPANSGFSDCLDGFSVEGDGALNRIIENLQIFSSSTLEEYVDALIYLRDKTPNEFKKIIKKIVKPAEMVAVFSK